MGERGAAVGDLRLATVVVNALDMRRAIAFWQEALGYELGGEIGEQFAMLEDPAKRGPAVLVQQAEAIPREAAPVHIDLYTAERERHIERLVQLGASRVEDWDYPEEHEFVVLRDTEGNEFCVIRAD
ncbi:VOC family protein [Kribbella sp. NPDC051770]|uniref:VOC family protein n=1 Tax=Kribbella sp. NPDC051770 TaxID=3155413 RepID=UPI0034211511